MERLDVCARIPETITDTVPSNPFQRTRCLRNEFEPTLYIPE
jgi:hypothetical protein